MFDQTRNTAAQSLFGGRQLSPEFQPCYVPAGTAQKPGAILGKVALDKQKPFLRVFAALYDSLPNYTLRLRIEFVRNGAVVATRPLCVSTAASTAEVSWTVAGSAPVAGSIIVNFPGMGAQHLHPQEMTLPCDEVRVVVADSVWNATSALFFAVEQTENPTL